MSDDRLGRVHLDSKGLSSFKPAIADAGLQGIAGLFFLKIAPYSTNPRLAARIDEGRVDCGFLRLPTLPKFDTILLKQDEYKVVPPSDHALAKKETVAAEDLNGLPFLLLEHGGKTEVSDLLEQYHVQPDIRFITWEDFAIMAMVEKGMGVSILPDMILRRIPYQIEIRSLQTPYYRPIGLAMKHTKALPPAVQKFIEYLPFREKK